VAVMRRQKGWRYDFALKVRARLRGGPAVDREVIAANLNCESNKKPAEQRSTRMDRQTAGNDGTDFL